MLDAEFQYESVHTPKFGLTPTEIEILQKLANGEKIKEIANHYHKSDQWVSNLLWQTKRKVHAITTCEAVVIALRRKLIL